MKKYEFTDETIQHCGVTLCRIRALRNLSGVFKGNLGGYIEKESNLDHEGDCWVSGNARVWGDARVSGDAQVWGNARVSGDAQVYGDVWVYGNYRVKGDTKLDSGYYSEYNPLSETKCWRLLNAE